MWLVLLAPALAALPPKDGNGGISLQAWFTPQDYAALGVQSGDEADYCELFELASQQLWVTTEGQHYIKNVTFLMGTHQDGVRLVAGDERSNASYGNQINLFHELPIDLVSKPKTLNHELGHYFYGLPDEYLEVTKSGVGYCADETGSDPFIYGCTSVGGSSCTSGAYCNVLNGCVGGEHDGKVCLYDKGAIPENYLYVHPDDCVAGKGVCLSGDPESEELGVCLMGGDVGEECLDNADCAGAPEACTTELDDLVVSVDIPIGEDSCVMASSLETRWCGENHQHVIGPGGAFTNSLTLDQGGGIFGRVQDGYFDEPEDYNCWDMARYRHADLDWDGTYTPEADLGSPPDTTCTWSIDELDMSGSTAVVVDSSGSMMEDTAYLSAIDGAEFLNNQALNIPGAGVGLYHFDSDFFVLPHDSLNLSMADAQDLGEGIDRDAMTAYMDPDRKTHICEALQSASLVFFGRSDTDRKVVLLTDGVDTSPEGCDPVAKAQELCDELGISVHALAYGDADVAVTREMTNAGCGTMKYAPPGWLGLSGPHALQMGMAQIGALAEGEIELFYERQKITSGISGQTVAKQVLVPEGAETITFTWMGSSEAWVGSPLFDKATYTVTMPSGVVKTVTGGTDEDRARYRTLEIEDPEPGVWLMTLDAHLPTLTAPLQFEAGWLATMTSPAHGANAWTLHTRGLLGQPMTVLGQATLHNEPLTSLEVSAEVIYDDQRWSISMHDDGMHRDDAPGDGVYGGDFVPAVAGPYNVEVTFEGDDLLLRASTAFQALPYEPWVGTSPSGAPLLLPDLYRGGVYRRLHSNLIGLPLSEALTTVSLGDGVDVFDVEVKGTDFYFDALVSSTATLGSRDLIVQVGASQYRLENALDIIAAPVPTAFAAGTLVISEIEVDAEWFEVHNPGTRAVDLYGLVVQDNSGQSMSLLRPVPIPSKGYVRIDTEDTMTLSSADTLKLKSGATTVDTVSWGSGWPVTLGSAMSLNPTKLNTRDNDRSTSWCVDEPGTPGLANDPCAP